MLEFTMLSGRHLTKTFRCPKFKVIPTCLFSILLIAVLLAFFLPFRNAVLRPVGFPDVWRDIKTTDIVKRRYFNHRQPEDFSIRMVCENLLVLDLVAKKYEHVLDPKRIIHHNNVSMAQTKEMLRRGLGRFLPYFNVDQKIVMLRLYVTLATALENANVPFFLASGTLFGAARHGGFIPWDDDMDIAIDVEKKRTVHKALSCVVGGKIERSAIFHWKFHLEGHDFPFIDIFLYDKDDTYLWALTPYITRVILYKLTNVFPLTTIRFEGNVTAPAPGTYMNTLHRVYRFSQCVAHKSHGSTKRGWLKQFPDGYSKSNIRCSELSDFYQMNYLDD